MFQMWRTAIHMNYLKWRFSTDWRHKCLRKIICRNLGFIWRPEQSRDLTLSLVGILVNQWVTAITDLQLYLLIQIVQSLVEKKNDFCCLFCLKSFHFLMQIFFLYHDFISIENLKQKKLQENWLNCQQPNALTNFNFSNQHFE